MDNAFMVRKPEKMNWACDIYGTINQNETLVGIR
jgi:hypothetical protein